MTDTDTQPEYGEILIRAKFIINAKDDKTCKQLEQIQWVYGDNNSLWDKVEAFQWNPIENITEIFDGCGLKKKEEPESNNNQPITDNNREEGTDELSNVAEEAEVNRVAAEEEPKSSSEEEVKSSAEEATNSSVEEEPKSSAEEEVKSSAEEEVKSSAEEEVKSSAEEEAKRAAEEEAKRALEEEAKRAAEEDAKRAAEEEAKRAAEEAAKRAAEEEAKRAAEEDAKRAAEEAAKVEANRLAVEKEAETQSNQPETITLTPDNSPPSINSETATKENIRTINQKKLANNRKEAFNFLKSKYNNMIERDKKQISAKLRKSLDTIYNENDYNEPDENTLNLNDPSYMENTQQSINKMVDPSKFLIDLMKFKDPKDNSKTINIEQDINYILGKNESESSTKPASFARPTSASNTSRANTTLKNNNLRTNATTKKALPFKVGKRGGKKRNLTFKKRR
jgi:hypothetical protein